MGFEVWFEPKIGFGPVEELEREGWFMLGVVKDFEEERGGEFGGKIDAFEEWDPVVSLQENGRDLGGEVVSLEFGSPTLGSR